MQIKFNKCLNFTHLATKWRINYPQQKTKMTKKMAIKKLTKKSEASDFAPAPDDNYSENNPK